MKFIPLVFLCMVVITGNAYSQSAEDSVKAAVNQLFTAMKNADAAMIKNSFADSAILQSIHSDKMGKTVIENEAITAFANSISKLPKDAADERIEFNTIKIDGDLASVWTPYKFYYKGQFSHCGADSFQLVKINGVWKIQYLIDTRRKDCN